MPHHNSDTVHGLFIHSFIQAEATGYRLPATGRDILSVPIDVWFSSAVVKAVRAHHRLVEKQPRDKKKKKEV
jgi:hypothetical protein